jgi:hypothetical protein
MSFHKSEPIATYDFDEDAMGLGDFITQEMAKLRDDEIVVLVSDQEGYNAIKATFERELLTDGSTVVNLIIKFDREI